MPLDPELKELFVSVKEAQSIEGPDNLSAVLDKLRSVIVQGLNLVSDLQDLDARLRLLIGVRPPELDQTSATLDMVLRDGPDLQNSATMGEADDEEPL